MHSIRQNVDDNSIYILPKDKVEILSDSDNSISFEEAKCKVSRAAYNVSKQEGLDLDTVIDNILNS